MSFVNFLASSSSSPTTTTLCKNSSSSSSHSTVIRRNFNYYRSSLSTTTTSSSTTAAAAAARRTATTLLSSRNLVTSRHPHTQSPPLPPLLIHQRFYHNNNNNNNNNNKSWIRSTSGSGSSGASASPLFASVQHQIAAVVGGGGGGLPQVPVRTVFPFFRPEKVKQLEEQANATSEDTKSQEALLKEWLALGRYSDITARVESQKFPLDDAVRKIYVKALIRDLRLDEQGLFTNGGTAGVGAGAGASGSSATGASNQTRSGSGFANPFSGLFGKGSTDDPPVRVQIVQSKSSRYMGYLSGVSTFLILVMLLLLAYIGYSQLAVDQKRGGPFSISNAHQEVERVETKFVDVKGCEEAKEELVQIVEYLKNPSKFTRLGARPPKGVLLVGEPGTGKTLLARALAGEAGVPFLYCTGSSFDELYVGVGPRRIKTLFEDAKRLAPCIIFIDEIDSVGGSRKYSQFGSSAREATLNQLLTEMDGFKATQGIIVIGATNFPESLDPAIVRPGRFDKQVVIPVPDLKGRKEIIDYYLNKVVPSAEVDSLTVARGTYGFTGADIANLINIAATRATVQGKPHVDAAAIEEAKDEIVMGLERKSDQDPLQKKITAYHEGGHTIVALYTNSTAPLHKATIIQRGSALGVTVRLPESDNPLGSRSQLLADLAISMGGRAAEEMLLGAQGVTGGASSDIKSATQIAYQMVTKYGMSDKIGMVHHNLAFDSQVQISDRERQMVDAEVKEIIQNAHNTAKKILQEHEEELHKLAKALLEYETLSAEEIKLVVAGKPLNRVL